MVSIPTSLTEVQLGVDVQGRTAAEVQQMAAQKSSAIVALLRSRQVDKLYTTGIQLSPNYRYENDVQKLDGFTASNTVSFQVPTEQAGALMDQAVQAGATQINGIQFIAPEATIATAHEQALQEATQDAQDQADAVLASLGLKPLEILSIQVDGANAPSPVPVPFVKAMADSVASTPVVGSEQDVYASVTLQIRY
jgi:uncharacterized protein YggE